MAVYVAAGNAGQSNQNLWVGNTGDSTNEGFGGDVTATGAVLLGLIGSRTFTFSQFSFQANGLTYTYIGEFTVTLNTLLITGEASVSGSYDTIVVSNGADVQAVYSGLDQTVDFGPPTPFLGIELLTLLGQVLAGVGIDLQPTVALLNDLVGDLLFGPETERAFAGMHLDASPNLVADSFAGADVLFGDNSGNALNGEASSDLIFGIGGNDVILAGAGDDHIEAGAGADFISGGDGFDFARYDQSATGVTVNLTTHAGTSGDAAGDVIGTDVEGIVGSLQGDTLTGDAGSNWFFGLGGADTISGGDNVDVIAGGDDNDLITGGSGGDALYGGNGIDTFAVSIGDLAVGVYDYIADFQDGVDLIDLTGFANLTFTANANGVIITNGGNSGIIVLGMTQAQVQDQII